MNKWTKTAGLLFMAAASVYSGRAIAAKPAKPAVLSDKNPATDVKLLEETDPFAAPAPTTVPSNDVMATTENKAPVAPLQLNPDGTFSLNITGGAEVVEQLRVIGYQAQMSIIPSKEVHGALPAMDLYNVTVHEALDALLHPNGYAWREKGKFIYVYSAKEIAQQEKEARVSNTEVFRLYYTPAANAVTMIKPVLSADAQVATTTPTKAGIPTGISDVGGNDHSTEELIVITDYPENLERVRQVLKEVDRRPLQILVEATILRASLNEDNALGVDFNIVGGVDFSTITHSNGQLTNANLATGSLATSGSQVHSAGTGNSFRQGIDSGLKVGLVTNNVSVFLSALEGITDTTVLANPKIMALNKQRGEVIVGKETGYLTTTTTETSSTQTVEFLKTGTRLVFRPFIGDDGYIRMEVHPEDSSGGLQTAANLPYKFTTEVTSNIMVKDGHTIVIGGLFRESSDSTKSQIPVLGNLPIAGPLFRQQKDSTTREEVIILLTPHIVKDDAAYSQLSEQEMRNAEMLRVGVRQGMMFWGRERLANMYFESAVSEMNKPRPNRTLALWSLDAATNLNPKFLEALKMKQELTGKQLTSSDNSSIRSFVRRAVLEDRAPATQPTAAIEEPREAKVAMQAPAPAPKAEIKEIKQTNPLVPMFVEAPAKQPANVAAVEMKEPEQQQEVIKEEVAVVEESAPEAAPPATQPAVAEIDQSSIEPDWADEEEASAPETIVTELPSEELPDLNK